MCWTKHASIVQHYISKLRNQLESTRGRLDEVQEQLGQLTLRLRGNECVNHQLSPTTSTSPTLNFPLSSFGMNALLPTGGNPYIDVQGHTTPGSTNLTVTPDPFSPFQRFNPLHASPDHAYASSIGYHPQAIRTSANAEPFGTNSTKAASNNEVSRLTRPGDRPGWYTELTREQIQGTT
jgi:hypothetical protein